MRASVTRWIEPRDRPVGSGTVRRLLPFRTHRTVGPFTFLDVMGPEEFTPPPGSGVDAHPHIGMSTLTYLLRGRGVHRDSTGAVQTIDAGAVNWMTAGAGVTHTERPHPDDVGRLTASFGVQLWVALPDDTQDGPAFFEHSPASAVPSVEVGSSTVRIAAGTGWGEAAPVSGSSPLVLAELDVQGAVRVPSDHPERAVLALDGDLTIDDRTITNGHLAVLEAGAEPTIAGHGTVIVIGGEPVGPRHIWWNFVHADPDVIEDAKDRWRRGEFPTVPGDHDDPVPLPAG